MSNHDGSTREVALNLDADNESGRSTATLCASALDEKPVIVGLYGVPGSGKTTLLKKLEEELGSEHFAFYEGSQMIGATTTGGIEAFHRMNEQEKVVRRQFAIDEIGRRCAESKRAAIVASHFMFWPEEENSGHLVYTQNDMDTFTHILYLDVPAELLVQRRLKDTQRTRPAVSFVHLWRWQMAERDQLRSLCYQHGILFSRVCCDSNLLRTVSTLLHDFDQHTEEHNTFQAERALDNVVVKGSGQIETMLVMDADRTLAAEDTGALFWELINDSWWGENEEFPLKTLFGSSLGYTYKAFRQATLLYEETVGDPEFEALCVAVASKITMHPDFVSLLHQVAEKSHVGAVIVSCGIRRVWVKVLEREGLSETVEVIAGGRIADGFVVTAEVKEALVDRLRDIHKMYVWAFGDSPLDLKMLSKADQAIVVVGEERTRSKTMDKALLEAIDHNRLDAMQVLLPNNASPRLDTSKLPLVQFTDQAFTRSVFCRRKQVSGLEVITATKSKAAQLLMTPMRDAFMAGPALREAHRRVGWYLGVECLTSVIGLEEYDIAHVQGHLTTGYRLKDEMKTLIVALMRGGEAMAFGVSDAFPDAMFVHANRADALTLLQLSGKTSVILVDAVVNTGKTVVEFVQHIRSLTADIHIVVVAGVIQTQSVSSEGSIAQALVDSTNLSFIALRLSDNKFTGRGTTDTGNRLFNTTHMA